MTKSDLILAILAASEGRPVTGPQLQRSLFLAIQYLPAFMNGSKGFDFTMEAGGAASPEVGPLTEALSKAGDVTMTPGGPGRWASFAASESGLSRGRMILATFDELIRHRLRAIPAEVCARSPRTRRYTMRRVCFCGEC